MMTVDRRHGRAGRVPGSVPQRIALFFFLVGWMAAAPASAQEADSVRTGGEIGTAVTDSLPVRLAALDLAELLGTLPGAFLYRFAAPGWPDGWSPGGLPPQRSVLTLNDIPFTHVFTGRPGLDIAPTAFIDPPRLAPQRFGRPAAVLIHTRPFGGGRPLTELKYWKGGDGLESVDVVHAQNRRVPLFGRPGFLNVLGSYSGRGSDGDYPGSELHRGRHVQVRIHYEQPGWSAEIHQMHTRRTVGAHGGVIPDASGFESVYRRVAAEVENVEARRRLLRNDLAATARVRFLRATTTLGAFWTAETFRYRDAADTVGTASDRIGLRFRQPLPAGLTAEIHGWMDRVEPRYRFAAGPLRRTELHATLRDSLAVLGWTASIGGGVHAYGGSLHLGGFIDLSRAIGPFRLNAGASLSGEPASPAEQMGFLSLGAATSDHLGRIADAHLQLAWRGRSLDGSIRAFGSRVTDSRDIYMATDYQAVPDSASVLIASSAMLRAGLTIDFGWRRDAERGLYGLLQPSAIRLLNDGDSDVHVRTGRALPFLFGRARLGARFTLFRGDLDLDTYAEAHVWSRTTGRALHPETGLLAIPALGAVDFGPSSMINIGADAGVREATLFFVFENVLSGTTLMPGNLIVPVYPLPARRFRFGVFWPILD